MTERFRAENKERTARQEKIREYYEREKIREEQQAKARGDQRQEDTPTLGDSEWESVGQRSSLNAPPTASPSPADARDLVAGESEKKVRDSTFQMSKSRTNRDNYFSLCQRRLRLTNTLHTSAKRLVMTLRSGRMCRPP